MEMVILIITLIVGIGLGIWLHKQWHKKDMDVEQAIALLKEKGYYVRISVPEEKR